MSPEARNIVVLSSDYDLIAEFGAAFAELPIPLTLAHPRDVDRKKVRYALVHAPEDDAFTPYPRLEMVCSWGAGVDKLVDHPGMRADIALNRMVDPGQAEMMAAFAAHYVTGWHRGMFRYPAQQRAETWEIVNWTPNAEVPVGLLGFGRMGAAIGRGLRALGYTVTAWASRGRAEGGIEVLTGAEGLRSLLNRSIVLINSLPLTPATEGLFNAEVFAAMRADALFVHLGRGPQVVEDDLIDALDAGRPGGAALDVFSTEPLPQGHALWRHQKVMVTPHAACAPSPEGVAQSVARAIKAHEAGERPPGYVDRAKGY